MVQTAVHQHHTVDLANVGSFLSIAAGRAYHGARVDFSPDRASPPLK